MNILRRRFLEAQIHTSVGLAGHFRLVVSRPDGSVARELEFENLVLDAGLNRLGTDAAITWCAIGTGTAAPAASQTTLQTQSASTNSQQPGSSTSSGGITPFWTGYTWVFRFPIGSLNGNYSEVGVGWTSTLMYARALIVDAGGSPTTITVGVGEQLDVYYTRRVYPPLADVVTTPSISGVTTTVTCRAELAGSSARWRPEAFPAWAGSAGAGAEVYSGALGLLTASPSGTSVQPSSVSNQSYSNNSLTRRANIIVGTTLANFGAGGVQSGVIWWQMCSFQYGFSPGIAKTSSLSLALEYSTSWARRP
jgi:hypothetical protein